MIRPIEAWLTGQGVDVRYRTRVEDIDYAGDQTTTELIVDKRDASWTLWQNVARKFDDFGKPDVFCAPISETKWKSFTLTMHSTELLDAIEAFSGNVAGENNLMTWHQSKWFGDARGDALHRFALSAPSAR